MIDSRVLESNQLFIDAWSFWAERSPDGSVSRPAPGVVARWMNHAWPICNLMFFDTPVDDEVDLVARIRATFACASGLKHGWLLFVSPDMLPPELRARAPEIFAQQGLPHAEPMTGMVADSFALPQHELPNVEYVRVRDEHTRRSVGTVNAEAYGIPNEWGIEAVNYPSMWPDAAFGYLAIVDGKAVSTATVVSLESCHYVGLVATLPAYQQRGYGEAVMRHALEQAALAKGPKRMALHATEAGKSLYATMGFREVAPFIGHYASEG
ncbi:GNAT family N-acetyltransferase [Sorangium sp. So ce327]|uniref:GNAT family N-acetyltransferase n=1 Tax=Sorangium sp. So ce327 TaxID=3133301 RepID=UPI003F610D14